MNKFINKNSNAYKYFLSTSKKAKEYLEILSKKEDIFCIEYKQSHFYEKNLETKIDDNYHHEIITYIEKREDKIFGKQNVLVTNDFNKIKCNKKFDNCCF